MITRRSFLLSAAAAADGSERALVRVADLSSGRSEKVWLSDGTTATVKVTGARDFRDSLRSAVRRVDVRAEVNGVPVTLVSGPYRLPVAVGGVQVDCPFTRHYLDNANGDSWGLDKDVRLRFWPAGSPWMPRGAMVYPVRQRWFATYTQMGNEPTYVDGGERINGKKIYYHSGLDIGGAEGLVPVVAATSGLLVQVGKALLQGHENSPAQPRYDVLYVVDERGWYYRYSHLFSFAEGLEPGQHVKQGQQLGLLGKEGASGGWSHLHFEIKSRQPSGKWGTQEGYAFLWEAYQRQYKPALIAVARPHHLAKVGEKVVVDGSRSWGKISRYDWKFTDGGTASGVTVERTYERPGTYSEILKVTDARGRIAYDFAAVQVLDPSTPDRLPPTIHAAYYPTMGIRVGQPVTFKVRTFRTTEGSEQWDFGDGSPAVEVKSDGCVKALAKDGYAITTHAFAKPGIYLARVERKGAVAHLAVEVEKRGQ